MHSKSRILVGQAAVMHIAGKASCADAALLHLDAIGVVDHIFEVDALGRRGTHGQNLVGTDAEVAVAQKTVMRSGEAQPATGLVEHDKVVAGPLHFGKRNAHGVDYRATLVCRNADSWRDVALRLHLRWHNRRHKGR